MSVSIDPLNNQIKIEVIPNIINLQEGANISVAATTNVVNLTENKPKVIVQNANNTVTVTEARKIIVKSNGSIGPIGPIGPQGPIGKDDFQVIAFAESTSAAFTYTGNNLTGITYADSIETTNSSKVLSYTSTTLDSIIHTFNYLVTEFWTVTTTLTYVSDRITAKTIILVKI